jgi:hypothetical protein
MPDCYMNLPLMELSEDWHRVVNSSDAIAALRPWEHSKPCLCPDQKNYPCDNLPKPFDSSVCYFNHLYRKLAKKAWKRHDGKRI